MKFNKTVGGVLLYSNLLLCSLLLKSKRLVKVVTTQLLKLSFVSVRLASKDTFTSLSQITLDARQTEVLAGVTQQPRLLPWELDTIHKLYLF